MQMHNDGRSKPYRALLYAKGASRYANTLDQMGPWRATPEEAAQDYLDLTIGMRYAPSPRLTFAGHSTIKQDRQVSDKRAQAYQLLKEAAQEESTDLTGYVYCISDGTAMKIGMSIGHPQNRLKSLQTGNPRLLTLLAFKEVPDRIAAEIELHLKYQATNILGEWFKYDKRILKEFK